MGDEEDIEAIFDNNLQQLLNLSNTLSVLFTTRSHSKGGARLDE